MYHYVRMFYGSLAEQFLNSKDITVQASMNYNSKAQP